MYYFYLPSLQLQLKQMLSIYKLYYYNLTLCFYSINTNKLQISDFM